MPEACFMQFSVWDFHLKIEKLKTNTPQTHFSVIKNNKPCFYHICLPCCHLKQISNTFYFLPTMFVFKHWHFSLAPNSCTYLSYSLCMMILQVFYHGCSVKPSYASTSKHSACTVSITFCFDGKQLLSLCRTCCYLTL